MDRVELFSLGESMGKVNLDNKNILVTGAAGFIGSNLIKRIYRSEEHTSELQSQR